MATDTHTRRYLHAFLVPYSTLAPGPAPSPILATSAQAALSSPRLASISASRAAAGESGSSHGDGSVSDATTSSISPAFPGEERRDSFSKSIASRPGTVTMSRSSSTGLLDRDLVMMMDIEARTRKVLDLLSDSFISEEEKPDKLRELLSQVTAGTEASSADLDGAVLAILHRHREDMAPTGQSFSSPTPASRQTASISRSSSFRRNLTPTSASTLSIKRANGITTPTRPISPSPLRSQSPSLHSSRKESIDPFNLILHNSSSDFATSSVPSSPFGSPRFLNAGALEFRPNITAPEFRPSTPTLSSSNLTVKLPEHIKSRAPIGTPVSEMSPTVWSFQNSPLGTPKFAIGGVGASPSFTGSNNGSYFPTAGLSIPVPPIPSDPWTRLSDSSIASIGSNPGISHSASTASSEASYDELQFDSIAASPSSSHDPTKSAGKAQILSSADDDEEEWGIPSTSYQDAASTDGSADGDQAHWNLYEDEEDDNDLHLPQFKAGRLAPDADELAIVLDSATHQRPVFHDGYYPQSTAQYSQLPQNLPSLPSAKRNLPSPHSGSGGLGIPSENYVMTPFDVLCTIFAGSDVSPTDLEEALSKNGWDVDRSMEWIINNLHLQGAPTSAEDQVDRLNMLSLDFNDQQPTSGSVSPARMRSSPAPSGSGSRPLVISRDSFQRNYAGANRPASPRWASGEGRPGTPNSKFDKAGDAYFGAGGAAPSTRLCKYYLQGNCLRSDCRFSHDLSKAVCKFWLRGHCLKGEGRCEFLHSVPPHLSNDIAALRASALRGREQEKGRFYGGPPEEEANHESANHGREDFPTLAAATASNSQRPGGPSRTGGKDQAAFRWAGIVKNGRALPVNNRSPLSKSPPSSSVGLGTDEPSAPFSQPRKSRRLALRAPTLLPTITTGTAVNKMYDQYRENFFEIGNARNKCLVKAADCWRSGDGAGAKRWSREAQDWNRQIAQEGAVAASNIIEERKKVLRAAIMSGEGRPGRPDDAVDRQYRGKDCGAGLGLCLGVAANGPAFGPEGARLSASERTEAALDLHGLHPDEAIDILEKFLLAIPREATMLGLVYVIVGQEKHTGTADAARGSRKVRLADALGSWLDSFNYAFWLTNGIYAIDPYL